MWNSAIWANDKGAEEESETTGRLGRFQRRYEELDWDNLDMPVEQQEGRVNEREKKDVGKGPK
jgi:hypothetical protein